MHLFLPITITALLIWAAVELFNNVRTFFRNQSVTLPKDDQIDYNGIVNAGLNGLSGDSACHGAGETANCADIEHVVQHIGHFFYH